MSALCAVGFDREAEALEVEGIHRQRVVEQDSRTVGIRARSAVGGEHTLAIKSDGSLWAWGLNNWGQLGTSTALFLDVPTHVDNGYADVVAGQIHSLALKPDGSLWTWGGNSFGQLGIGSTATKDTPVRVGTGLYNKLASGDNHSMAIRTDGKLFAWGWNFLACFGWCFLYLGRGYSEYKTFKYFPRIWCS